MDTDYYKKWYKKHRKKILKVKKEAYTKNSKEIKEKQKVKYWRRKAGRKLKFLGIRIQQ